jgi:signal transduction histidine kinase
MVIAHLVGNARENGAGQVTCTMEPDCLRISDDGPGISQGNRNRIFDPYFTTNRDTGGTGMGLPIVRRMLEAHGAEIRLADGPGTVFEILF